MGKRNMINTIVSSRDLVYPRAMKLTAPLKNRAKQDVNIDKEGVRICRRGKSFLVPFNNGEPQLCLASHLINYMEVLRKSVEVLSPADALFRAPSKGGFAKTGSLGRERASQIGKNIAREMGLDNPEAYGTRAFCLRRNGTTEDVGIGTVAEEPEKSGTTKSTNPLDISQHPVIRDIETGWWSKTSS